MSEKPTYEELEQRIQELEQAESKYNKVEETLRESDERYRLIAENATDVIWLLDPESQTFKYASPSVERVLGFTDKESINRSLAQTVTPTSLEYIQRTTPIRIERMLQGDTSYYTDEIEVIHKDGHIVPTEINMHFVKNQFTGLIEGTGVMRDITQRKQAEEALRASRDYFEKLTNSIWDAVFSVKMPERVIEWANDSFKHIGYEPSECVGKDTSFLYPDKDGFLDFGNKLKNAMSAGKDVLHTEHLLIKKKRQDFYSGCFCYFL